MRGQSRAHNAPVQSCGQGLRPILSAVHPRRHIPGPRPAAFASGNSVLRFKRGPFRENGSNSLPGRYDLLPVGFDEHNADCPDDVDNFDCMFSEL